MRLTSTDGTVVELLPMAYQFPGMHADADDDWDANWLVIRGDVRLPDGRHWSFEDPSLTTWDAADVARWLRRVAAGGVEATAVPVDEEELLAFTEPNLAFSLAATGEETVSVRVHFSLEARPRWAPPPGGDEDLYGFFVAVTTPVAELMCAIDEWDQERAALPPR